MNGEKPSTAKCARDAIKGVTTELAAIEEMTVSELHEKWFDVFGEASRSRNRRYLIKRLAYRLQEIAEGGLDAESLARIEELAATTPVRQRRAPRRKKVTVTARAETQPAETTADAGEETLAKKPAKPRDPRLPPAGTVLTRAFSGIDHAVTVRDDGFEYAGDNYRSLSGVARAITGTSWNGWTFFNLGAKKKGGR